jgi:TPR repeat protein
VAHRHAESLMARGLKAIEAQQAIRVPFDVDPYQKLIDGTIEAWNSALNGWNPKGTSEAIQLATMAAEQGCARAQFLLGLIFRDPRTPEPLRNDVLAYMWFHVASEHFVETDSILTTDKAIEARDSTAEWLAPAELTRARRLAAHWAPRHSGDPGDPEAQYDIAEAYQYQLGIAFANGIGVQQDLVAAHVWFTISWGSDTSAGPSILFTPAADLHLEDIERIMTATQITEARRRAGEWMTKHGQQPPPP